MQTTDDLIKENQISVGHATLVACWVRGDNGKVLAWALPGRDITLSKREAMRIASEMAGLSPRFAKHAGADMARQALIARRLQAAAVFGGAQ